MRNIWWAVAYFPISLGNYTPAIYLFIKSKEIKENEENMESKEVNKSLHKTKKKRKRLKREAVKNNNNKKTYTKSHIKNKYINN